MATRRPAKKNRRDPINWGEVQKLYETKAYTIEDLAKRTGISKSQLYVRRKQEGWGNGMSAVMVARRTRERLIQSGAFDDDVEANIEIAAATNVQIIREHQTVAARGRRLALKMLAELEDLTDNIEPLERIADAAKKGESINVVSMLTARLEIHRRASTLKDLASSTATWIDLERKAFNMDQTEGPENLTEEQVEVRLQRILRKHQAFALAAPAEYIDEEADDDIEDVEPAGDGA